MAAAAPARSRLGGASPDAVALLRQGATDSDALQAACAALLLAWNAQLQRGGSAQWPPAAQLALADAGAWMAGSRGKGGRSSSYQGFIAALVAGGWAVQHVALLQGRARLVWGADLRSG